MCEAVHRGHYVDEEHVCSVCVCSVCVCSVCVCVCVVPMYQGGECVKGMWCVGARQPTAVIRVNRKNENWKFSIYIAFSRIVFVCGCCFDLMFWRSQCCIIQ